MMMNHRYILFTGLMVTALCIHAQDIELQTKEKYEYADATQLWRRTLNPAGLSFVFYYLYSLGLISVDTAKSLLLLLVSARMVRPFSVLAVLR